MQQGKTIKQIADEIGVSKQAIHQKRKSKKLAELLKPFTSTVDGVVYISVDGENIIKSAFLQKDCKRTTVNEPSTVDGSFTLPVDGDNLEISGILQNDCKQTTVNRPSTVDGSFTPPVDGENDILVVLKATIDTLQGQLKSKDEQINMLQSELALERQHSREQSEKIAILADQAQKLQLAQMTPELKDGNVVSENLEKKSGFISKIFRRK